MVKIKISHTEVEAKALLEVLAVYCILALALIGAYYLGPAITGLVTVTKEVNYTDEVNLEFRENGEYVWNLANPGELKSIKIGGRKSTHGEAKAYVESNGIRYLIFDSSRLVEKTSGMFGITGFVAADDKDDKGKSNESQGNEPNHPPVWNSSVDEFALDGILIIDLNNYFEDKDNDALAYSASELKTSDLEIALKNSELTVSNPGNAEGNRILEITASDNETSKKKNVVLVLALAIINETPIINDTPIINLTNQTLENETQMNETAEKIINVNLGYGHNDAYDANNDGVESLSGVIDFSVDESEFNWDADEGKLCTRYEIFSIENQESTFACFGADDCCALVGLQSSIGLWNDELFLSYGSYGSSFDNIVFAQALYANYSLDIENPYSEIAYSSWGNLTAKFLADVIEFEDACVETCMFSGNESSYKLVIETENTTLWIDKIEYIISEEIANRPPILLKQIGNISIFENKEYVFDLSEYFYDDDNDELMYGYYAMDNLTIRFENDMAYIAPDTGFIGSGFTFISANDSFGQSVSNVFKIEVAAEVLGIEIVDSMLEGSNWTVGFDTTSTGNLTISAISGSSYSEMYNDDASTLNNLEILELRCGDFEIFDKVGLIETGNLGFILINNSKIRLVDLIGESMQVKGLYVENYNCDDVSYYTVKVVGSSGALEFNFGNETRNAGYEEAAASKYFEIRSDENEKLAVFDDSGNARIKGNLTQNAAVGFDGDDFIIQDSAGITNVVVTNPEGNMHIKGILNESQGLLEPTPNSFVIQDRNGNAVAYFDGNGSLLLKGTLTENSLLD